MRKPVTTDAAVLSAWPKGKKDKPKHASSAQVAKALGITVFQITARLKGMEGRGLVKRENLAAGNVSEAVSGGDWKWIPTGKEPAPEPVRGPSRIRGAGLPAVGLPDDTKVKKVKMSSTAPLDTVVKNAGVQLIDIDKRIKELEKDKKKFRTDLMRLYTGRDNCREILARAKGGGVWKTRLIREPKLVKFNTMEVKDGKKVKSAAHMVASQVVATVYTAPDGVEYVEATPVETAHLIAERTSGTKMRLRRLAESLAARKDAEAKREKAAREEAKKGDKTRIEEPSNAKKPSRLRGAREEGRTLYAGIEAPTADADSEQDEDRVRPDRKAGKGKRHDQGNKGQRTKDQGETTDSRKGGKGKQTAGSAKGKGRTLHGSGSKSRYAEFL